MFVALAPKMEEATLELRNAIHLALSLDPNNGSSNDHHRHADEMLNNDVQAGCGGGGHGSSEGTYISSLTGSLPSDNRSHALASRRKNYYAVNNNNMNNTMMEQDETNNNGVVGRHVWRRKCADVATRVEHAVSNYELAVFNNYHDNNEATAAPLSSRMIESDVGERDGFVAETAPEGIVHRDFASTTINDNGDGFNGDDQGDVVDLLVALLTTVPRNLLQQVDSIGENNAHNAHRQEEEDYLSSMEQICFNAACISSDAIRKYFQTPTLNMDNPPVLEDRHVYELIDEVVHICNTDPSIRAWSSIDPIVRILNSLLESREIERAMCEREQGDDEDGYQSIFSCLTSKDALRLAHTLMYRFVCEHEDPSSVEAASNSHVGYFVSHLLEHFAIVALGDMGYNSVDECQVGLFTAWADGVDEHMAPRLNDDEAQDVHTLIVRYHVAAIQSTLQLIENAESLVTNTISESEKNDGIAGESSIESLVVALQDAVRHMAMVVATAEAMDQLSLDHDPQIRTIFHPLMVSYARFIASFLHDAVMFLRRSCCDASAAHEGEEIGILADDLIFRICRVSLGTEFLEGSSDTGEEEEILAIALLRAMNSQCITGKARFLLDIAADRASVTHNADVPNNVEPIPKRQRFNSTFGSGQLPPSQSMYNGDKLPPSEERRGEMTDIILACLALSQSNKDADHPDSSSMKQASCITSALMFSQERSSGDGDRQQKQAVIDPLNPWHTIQVKPLQRLAGLDPCSKDGEETPHDSLSSYATSIPHLLDTKYSPSSLRH